MNWLFYGFLAAWLVHLGYLLSINLRQRQLRRELDSLRRQLESRSAPPSG